MQRAFDAFRWRKRLGMPGEGGVLVLKNDLFCMEIMMPEMDGQGAVPGNTRPEVRNVMRMHMVLKRRRYTGNW